MLTRSLFFQFFAPFLLGTFVLTFILSMDTVYKLINLIVSRGVPVGSVLLMLLYRLPQFFSVTIPIAVVISVVVVLVRLSNDLEVTAMRASGISPWQLALPVLLFGLLTTGLNLSITLWAQPAGYGAYEAETIKLIRSQTSKTIRPGVLNYDFPGKVLYVEKQPEGGQEMEGVFIADRDFDADSMVSLASKGRLLVREEQQELILQLEQGAMHFGDEEGGYRILDYETFQYQLRSPQLDNPNPTIHRWAMPTLTLIGREDSTSQRELQLRLTTPFACLAFALATLPLGMVDPRRGRSNAYLQALVLVVAHYILWSFSKKLTFGDEPIRAEILWMPPIVISLWGLYQLQRLQHNWLGPLEWILGHWQWRRLKEKAA